MQRSAVLTLPAVAAAVVALGMGHALPRPRHPTADRPALAAPAAAAEAVSATVGGMPLVEVWGGATRFIAGDGAIGYVAGAWWVEAIDMAADPPRLLGRHLFDAPIVAMAAGSSRLYVASADELIVLDASRPARLSELGRWALPPWPTGWYRRWVDHIVPDGSRVWLNVAYLTHGGEFNRVTAPHTVVALDVTSPQHIRSIGEVPVDPHRPIRGMWLVADRLAIAFDNVNSPPYVTLVAAWDVRDPAAPRFVGEAGPFNSFAGAAVRAPLLVLSVNPSQLLPDQSAERTSGIRMIDVAGADGPRLVGRWDSQDPMSGLHVIGDVALVRIHEGTVHNDGTCRVVQFAIHTPQPSEQQRRPCREMPPYGVGSHVFDGRLLAAAWYNATAVDATNPPSWEVWQAAIAAPRRIAARTNALPSAYHVAADAGRLLANGQGDADGAVLRLLEPVGQGFAARTLVAAAPGVDALDVGYDRYSGAVLLSGDMAVAVGRGKLTVLNISTAPARHLGELEWSTTGQDYTRLSGGFLGPHVLIAHPASEIGFEVVDLSDPTRPTRVSTPWDRLQATDMAADGGRMYVALRDGGLHIFEAGGSDGIRLVGTYAPARSPDDFPLDLDFSIAVSGDRVVLGSERGLTRLDVGDPRNVRVVTERNDTSVTGLVALDRDFIATGSFSHEGRWNDYLTLIHPDDINRIAWHRGGSRGQRSVAMNGRVYVPAGDDGILVFAPWRLPDGWRAVHRIALPWLSP